MPLGAFRLNSLGKFTLQAAAEVIRVKRNATVFGNAQISTAQSKFGGSSALFDGTGDYLVLDTSLIDPSSGNFTMEAWVRTTSTTNQNIIGAYNPSGANVANLIDIQATTGYVRVRYGATSVYGTSSVADGNWHHIASVLDNGYIKLFVDGVQQGSTTQATGTLYEVYEGRIGSLNYSQTRYFNGNIDEVRVSNTARYTSNFTPSTTPFVNDANTRLLLHMDGTTTQTYFEDDNGIRAKKGVYALGNAQVSTTQSKFGGTSAYFDGTGDYLKSLTNSDFGFNTGAFTVELWVYLSNTTGTKTLFDFRDASGTDTAPTVYVASGGQIRYYTAGADRITGSTLSANTWYHVALSRSGSSTKLFVNGTQVGSTYTDSNNYGTTKPLIIGARYDGTINYVTGYIDEMRVSNTARYTANFTPSTTPFINDTNTRILLHMNGTNTQTYFEDDNGVRAKNSIQAIGNAVVTTTQSKFGGTSLALDGAGDYLVISQTPSVDLSGDFTFEAWVYTLSIDSNYRGLWDTRNTSGSVLADEILIDIQSGGWRVFVDGSDRSTATLTTNTWYHVALVRNGTNFKFFINGTQDFTYNAASVKDYTMAYDWWIGNKKPQPTNYWYGYIDEVRISNSARYTATFTPQTTPHQNDDNTLLLLHMDGPGAGFSGATVFLDDNGVTPNWNYGA